MSEFRQATAHVEALEARLTEVQEALVNDEATDSLQRNLSFILTAINGEEDGRMNKYRARCVMLDPVSKQPRFGPKMMTKVQDLLRRYDDVKLAVQEGSPIRLQIDLKLSELKEQQEALQAEARAREAKAKEAQRAAEREKVRLEQEARKHEANRRKEEEVKIQVLAVAAQKKREQRERERREEARQRQMEEMERERLNASLLPGKEGLEMAIGMLRESTESETRFRQSMQKLFAVVTNICNSPETAEFRHIPKDNVHFHSDLGQFAGGYHCLLALGFKEVQLGDEKVPRVVFVLEEPDLSDDFDAWSAWFDKLKAMQSLIESKL